MGFARGLAALCALVGVGLPVAAGCVHAASAGVAGAEGPASAPRETNVLTWRGYVADIEGTADGLEPGTPCEARVAWLEPAGRFDCRVEVRCFPDGSGSAVALYGAGESGYTDCEGAPDAPVAVDRSAADGDPELHLALSEIGSATVIVTGGDRSRSWRVRIASTARIERAETDRALSVAAADPDAVDEVRALVTVEDVRTCRTVEVTTGEDGGSVERVLDEAPRECGRERVVGARVALFDGRGERASEVTNDAGEAMFSLGTIAPTDVPADLRFVLDDRAYDAARVVSALAELRERRASERAERCATSGADADRLLAGLAGALASAGRGSGMVHVFALHAAGFTGDEGTASYHDALEHLEARDPEVTRAFLTLVRANGGSDPDVAAELLIQLVRQLGFRLGIADARVVIECVAVAGTSP